MADEIEPDTKDWTWTATRRCEQCAYDPAAIPDDAIAGALRVTAPRWQAVLAGEDVRTRPGPTIWSALEYACHTRDVNLLFAERVGRMRTEDGPHFASWDGDEVALASNYGAQEPEVVAREMSAAVDRAAAEYDAVPGDGWTRRGYRGDGGEFTISSIGHYHLHDVLHHLHDVAG